MFINHWWSSLIKSDEGFTVKLLSRNYLRYSEGDICCDAFYEAAEGAADLSATLDSCETGLAIELQPAAKARIVSNIVRALESRGWTVTVIGKV